MFKPLRNLLILFLSSLAAPSFAQGVDYMTVPLDTIPAPDSLTEGQLTDYAFNLQHKAKALLDTSLLRVADAAVRRTNAGIELANAKADSSFSAAAVDSLGILLKNAEKNQAACAKQQKQAEKTLALIDKLVAMPPDKQRKNLLKCRLSVLKTTETVFPPQVVETPVAVIIGSEGVGAPKNDNKAEEKTATEPAPATTEPTPADTSSKSRFSLPLRKPKAPENTGPRFKPYNPEEDVMLHPPQAPCNLAVQSRDEFSGEVRKETAKAELLRYTNPIMRNYLKGKTHILCEAALGSAGPNQFLTLIYTINDPGARKAFGGIRGNNVLILKFVDGTTLPVYNQRNDEGTTDQETQLTTFKGQYLIDKATLKKLRSTELDKIRMAWNTGYEDYDVQQIDLLMRLSKCL